MASDPPLCEATSVGKDPCNCPCAGEALVFHGPSDGEVSEHGVSAEDGSWLPPWPSLSDVARRALKFVLSHSCKSDAALVWVALFLPKDFGGALMRLLLRSWDELHYLWKQEGWKVDWFHSVAFDCIPNAMWDDAEFCTE
ncbi:hypothetical protein Nepgr_029720 [Nepenthes gracilis]|uniref:Uncharacterized protein n=1 Tax=Nepenthes gracilis TaxID=150966 RepID=A0AAD3TEH8_NEPGR|nr:hypothetical protein Nepgr_029720 [Nepenthes gracilis]